MTQEVQFNLSPTDEGLSFIPAKVNFNDYDRIRSEALMLNDILHQIDINEDNVKMAKQLVAGVRAQVNVLDTERKEAKKRVMQEFNEFELQVKEINSIVGEGENLVRSKIRQLEEIEREEKMELVKELWDVHSPRYEFISWFGFDKWFDSRYLNKTQSINKTEEELVSWLESTRNDVMVIDSHASREDLMVIYNQNGGKLSEALITLQNIEAEKQEYKRADKVQDVQKKVVKRYIITLYNDAEYTKLVQLADRYAMDYDTEVVEK